MKYKVHASLVSFYAMALALLQEITEGTPNYGRGGGVASNEELINIADTAALFGRIAFHNAASVEECKSVDDSLSPAVKSANFKYGCVPDRLQLSDCYSYYEAVGLIDPLEADPMLFASKPGETDAATEARMRATGLSLLLYANDPQQALNESALPPALLGLLLLVAAAVIAIRSGRTSPSDVSYPQMGRTVRYFNGFVRGEALKAVVYGMAHAVVARTQLPQ